MYIVYILASSLIHKDIHKKLVTVFKSGHLCYYYFFFVMWFRKKKTDSWHAYMYFAFRAGFIAHAFVNYNKSDSFP